MLAAGLRRLERLAGDDAADLLGVEHFAHEQRVGDAIERVAMRLDHLLAPCS